MEEWVCEILREVREIMDIEAQNTLDRLEELERELAPYEKAARDEN